MNSNYENSFWVPWVQIHQEWYINVNQSSNNASIQNTMQTIV